jgi:TolA-binding protein
VDLPAPIAPPSLDAEARAHLSTAADLFAAAARARRARDLEGAIQRYRQLQSAFPRSPEARLSFVSLGDLLFSRGAYLVALQQLDGYLHSGETELLEEALLGRARALAALGRRADERAAWRLLLDRFPQSDYRWRAQQRLSVLDGPAGSVP